ncbi:MAG: hypothetical protein ACKVPX_16275 [Myxococcaceae bacterium]
MTKTPAEVESFAQSIRFTMDQANYLNQRAKVLGKGFAWAVRESIEDARTFYQFPKLMVERLDADAKTLGLDRREYIRYLLNLRYEGIVKGEISHEKEKRSR